MKVNINIYHLLKFEEKTIDRTTRNQLNPEVKSGAPPLFIEVPVPS